MDHPWLPVVGQSLIKNMQGFFFAGRYPDSESIRILWLTNAINRLMNGIDRLINGINPLINNILLLING